MPYTDLELFARLIECEAGGEGVLGMEAVASVVMNRVNATGGEYARVSDGGSLRNIILQPGQFACVATEDDDGEPNAQNIYNMAPTALQYAVAEWALVGNRVTDLGEALWFYAPQGAECREFFPSNVGKLVVRINEHCFYNPTELYYET
ncbi:MAG: cell wall hydrolase [Bacillota bacterium]|nr:cell wall hydrolase [Bacillota bacterium]